MANDISLFPTLTDDLILKIGFSEFNFSAKYHDDQGKEESLTLSDLDEVNTFKVSDEATSWTFDEYDLVLKKEVRFGCIDHLFGENGIACRDAELGIAVEWSSPSSRQRGTIKSSKSLRYNQKDCVFVIEIPFEKAQLRGCVDFRLIVYLQKSGHPSSRELHLANQIGLILGTLGEYSLILDGNGSTFPIFEIEEPRQALWRMKCDWSTPAEDLFNDCVAIYINKSHPNYKYLDQQNKAYDPQLIIEIMASALTIIIMKLKDNPEHWAVVENDKIAKENPGSVAHAINYMLGTFGDMDFSNIESISLSVRRFLEGRA